jgi:hypothetical protein
MDEFLDDFYFNREYWYRRVRTYPPPAKLGADNIREIRKFIEKTTVLAVTYNGKLQQYLDSLEELCEKGLLEESHDVSLYQWDGKDSNGLNLWLRKRGSNQCEILHQKMRAGFGPCGVRPEIGHYMLLLVTFFFNVNTGIRRNGWHDFGMP